MTGRTTKREYPLKSITNLTPSDMPSQHYSRASSSEEPSIARQVMEDAVGFYLANGGPAVARAHVEALANDLKFYPDSTEAYHEALARISQAEETERQMVQERNRQELQDMMKTMVILMPKHQEPVAKPCETTEIVLSPKLSSPKAMLMWEKLRQAGMIDNRYQPVGLSRTEVALLAEEMTRQLSDENDNLLDIKEWKPYETLWHRKNMKADLQRALTQDKTPAFRNRLKDLFAGISADTSCER